jgi:hypothetical protein
LSQGAAALAAAQDAFMAALWRDVVRFGGAVMIRRLVGIAHVADMDSIAGGWWPFTWETLMSRLLHGMPSVVTGGLPFPASCVISCLQTHPARSEHWQPCTSSWLRAGDSAHKATSIGVAGPDVRTVCERRALRFGRRMLVEGSEVASARQLADLAEQARQDGHQPSFPL